MLSHADTELVARERAIPGMATVLDPDAMAALLRAQPDIPEIDALQPYYVHYKPATNCLAAYRLLAGGTEHLLYAKAYGRDARVKFEKTRRLAGITTPLGPGTLVCGDSALAVYLFPVDHRLKALKRFADDERQHNLVKHIFRDRPELYDGRLTSLTYKPERRYVGRLEVAGTPQAILKFYNPAGYRAARTAARTFESSGALELPRLVACCDRFQALAFDWLNGCALSDLLRDPNVMQQKKIGVLQQTGAALAELQRQPVAGLGNRDHDVERSRLLSQAETIGQLAPDLYPRAARLAQQLAEAPGAGTSAICTLHGDFYDRQVLIGDDDRVIILDLDNAALGEAAVDPGLFIAHLERAVLRNELDADELARFADAFLQGYQEAGGPADGKGIRLYTAMGLFYLAAEPFRYREPDWTDRIGALLARIESLAANCANAGAAAASGADRGIRTSCL